MERPLQLLTTLLVLGGGTLVLGQSLRSNISEFCLGQPDGVYCATCLDVVYCNDEATVGPAQCNPLETVCEQTSPSVAGCVPMASATMCRCSADACDPYDGDSLDRCNSDGLYDVVECFSCQNEECQDTSSPPISGGSCSDETAPIEEWIPVAPQCTSAFYCDSSYAQTDRECDADHYVDPSGVCQPRPPQPCVGCTAQICPDLTNCHQFYTCDNGSPVGSALTCPNKGWFNASAADGNFCSESNTGCSPYTNCNWESTPGGGTTPPGGTTTPGGTTSSGATTPTACTEDTVGNYPYGACSQYYWSCRNTGGGNYAYIQMQCPNGLVFNTDPDYPYCDQPANVDTC